MLLEHSPKTSRNGFCQSGFSLLEILIALVIAGVLVSIAVINFGDDRDSELETSAKRFYALVKQAQDETLLRGIDLGIRVEDQRYWFYLFDAENEKWLPIQDDEFFTEKEIPESLELKLVVDGSTLFAEDEDDVEIFERDVNIFEDEDEVEIEPPQIYILSSGEMNDFKFALGWVDQEPTYYLVTGTMLGDVKIEGPMNGNLRTEVKDDEFLNL
ncbi:MAG: type II secretion system minor pseudopilin GspH [Gammaproteobacteria bacterium]|nr:type II secretion system minor pseudopilin GspH [Gammaproteobacteria bacterium]NVK86812.1 type II secretion system minor pseudopilin GspH [Gammaproteobacteria bacterium]